MSTSPVSRQAGAAEPETKDLGGRRALVTGGTRGMGAAIAELLVARGAHVIVPKRDHDASSAYEAVAGAEELRSWTARLYQWRT